MSKKTTIQLMIIALLSLIGLGLALLSCEGRDHRGSLLIVQGPEGEGSEGTRLLIYDPVGRDEPVSLFSDNFYRVGSPEISYDGESVLFEGKRTAGDPWQVWEYSLGEGELRRVTNLDADCRYPAYLPGDLVVYSRYEKKESLPGYQVLETCDLSGEGRKQITFAPIDYSHPTVLRDGRVLAVSRQVYPTEGALQLMVMRPDGTKAELFYKSETGTVWPQRASETEGGSVVFLETGEVDGSGAVLSSVAYNRPLGDRRDLWKGVKGDVLSANLLSGEGLLLSCRTEENGSYGIYSFDPGLEEPLKPIYVQAGVQALEAVSIEPRQRPKKLPSAVNPDMDTALLMVQDANFSGAIYPGSSPGEHKDKGRAVSMELIGTEGALGVARLEKDGSVYLKVPADVPFRMQTLDSSGSMISGPSGWITLRPNERRGCVGCHAGHERVPDNRQPLAVRKDPVDIARIGEAIMANTLKN